MSFDKIVQMSYYWEPLVATDLVSKLRLDGALPRPFDWNVPYIELFLCFID